MKRTNSITIPFGESDGKGQKASLILSNNSKVDISYDEVTSEIVLGGKTYAHGESFELDGKKAKFLNIWVIYGLKLKKPEINNGTFKIKWLFALFFY